MFNKTSLFSVNFSLPPRTIQHTDALVLSGMNISIFDEGLYSELQELNAFCVNSNDYGYGKMSIEICFEPIAESYCEFWANCISVRTDLLTSTLKIDTSLLHEKNNCNSYTKINSEGKMVLGVYYFFTTPEQRQMIVNSKSFLIEGFVALNKKDNVYGFMCAAEKHNDIWELADGMTNRPYNKTSILTLRH